MSDYNNGAAHSRDLIICLILGIQNNMNDTGTAEYQELQKLLIEIEDRYGKMFDPWKG